ncbi:hypothetical protein UPYG_G00174140 [Umbra pygmaea]|uniref:SUN domain-containing protein n=1 Tax=Umbra pygmaea TaxID=75934 RepID=A0ABD0X687_UMBPY
MMATQEGEMSRRSMRLVLGGYYQHSSEDEESSTVSYRESPVRVFTKRKTGGRKGATSRSSSRANSVASTSSSKASTVDPSSHAKDYNGISSLVESRRPFQDPPTVASAPTPASNLNLTTSSRSFPCIQTTQVQRQSSAIDSSGYSSSETRHFRGYSGHPSLEVQKVSSNHSPGTSRRTATASPSSSLTTLFKPAAVRKAILAALLIILIFACWYIATLIWSMLTASKTPNQPIITSDAPPAFTLPSKATDEASVFDSGLEARIKTFLREEMHKKQEHQQKFVNEIIVRLQTELKDMRSDVRDVKMKVDRVDVLDWEHLLSQQTASFTKRMDELNVHHTHIRQKLTALEDSGAKLQQQIDTLQNQPGPAPSPPSASTHLTPELTEAMASWLRDNVPRNEPQIIKQIVTDSRSPFADRMPDFALESQGASVVSTRCSETYHSQSACVSFLGIPLWYPSESPRTVIQGHPLQAGRCWAFQGAQGTLVIALSHPIRISHVTLEHLPVSNAPTGRIDSAPKAFSVYGMSTETEEGTLLGTFTYDQNKESTQTFQLPNPTNAVYSYVELRILSNWGHLDYTCVYRFRVHGQIALTST